MEKMFLDYEKLMAAIEGINWHSFSKIGMYHEGAPVEECAFVRYSDVAAAVEAVKKTPGVILPCKIGDLVWAIRSFKGICHPQQGIVSEIYFTQDMRLQIVVKNVARGLWNERVFSTYEEAVAAIEAKKAADKSPSIW